MNDAMPLMIATTIAFIVTVSVAFVMGRNSHEEKSRQESIENVKYYLEHSIPNEWQAYKKGVDEGYEQGLRDGQDNLQ